jgi:hypothetical protein
MMSLSVSYISSKVLKNALAFASTNSLPRQSPLPMEH